MLRLGFLAFGFVATLASADVADKVPLTIIAVQEGPSGLSPTRNTVFALATLDKYIFHEAQPHPDGTIKVLVSPGRYTLSALHGGKPLGIEVRAPSTIITVLVSDLGESVRVLPSSMVFHAQEKSTNTKRDDGGMTPPLWIGLGFVAAIVGFLMITSFVRLNQQADKNLRFLTALCAGFAGGFFTGDALFRYQQRLGSSTNILLSGTAGFALFLLVWLTYAKRSPDVVLDPVPDETVKMSFPEGWSFEQAAVSITNAAQRTIHFQGFDRAQLATRMPAMEIEAPTFRDALEQLRYHSGKVPEYRVDLVKGIYHIQRS
jgi:hypothetical protein